MFKYLMFTVVANEFTKLGFVGSVEGVEVHRFDKNVVALKSDEEAKIDELIAMQPTETNCVEITQAEFRDVVIDSLQLARIRQVVKEKIAKKYDVADEVSLMKKNATDTKRIVYDAHVAECIALGDSLKAQIGY